MRKYPPLGAAYSPCNMIANGTQVGSFWSLIGCDEHDPVRWATVRIGV
jgi:hypothetical protein